MTEKIEAVIEEVVIEPDKIQPILVNFLNGQLKDEATEKMKCGLYVDEKLNKTVLAMSNGRMVYKGYRPDPNRELNYTMLAIHNKRTGKVRLIQAERWDVAPVLDSPVDDKNDDNTDKIAILNKQFGSKKMKRRTEQYERMKINPDSVKDQLEQTVTNIKINEADLEFSAQDEFVEGVMLPPCNKQATAVTEVYNIYDIVPQDVLKTLYPAVDELVKNDISSEPVLYAEIVNKYKDKEDYLEKLAVLLYIEAIIKWLNIPIRSMKKQESEICPHSAEVITHIIQTYSILSVNGRQRPNSMRDKGIIHSIVLCLTLCDFYLDLEKFAMLGLKKIATQKLKDLARYIYAVPAKDNNKCIVLKLPLPDPAPRALVRRKKNR